MGEQAKTNAIGPTNLYLRSIMGFTTIPSLECYLQSTPIRCNYRFATNLAATPLDQKVKKSLA